MRDTFLAKLEVDIVQANNYFEKPSLKVFKMLL